MSLWGPFEEGWQEKLDKELTKAGITPETIQERLSKITPEQLQEVMRKAEKRAAAFRRPRPSTCPCPHCVVLD